MNHELTRSEIGPASRVRRWGRWKTIAQSCALLGLAAVGCGSYKDDLHTICDAYTLSGARATGNPSTKATVTARYIADHLDTNEAKQLMGSLGMASPEDKLRILRAALTKNGIDDCELLDLWSTAARAPTRPPDAEP